MKSMKRVLITAALPYANGNLHVGHIGGGYLPADTYARFCRSVGREIAFICGSDDHGVPALLTARDEGSQPADIVRRYHDSHLRDFSGLGIFFDVYGRTSTPEHAAMSQAFFLKVHENGYLEKRTCKQLYDPEANMFLPDRYIKGTCPHCGGSTLGDQCEECGKDQDPLEIIEPRSVVTGATPEIRDTTHWYFRQDLLQDRLFTWLENKTEWRATVRNFALGMLKQGLEPRAVTRDLPWGVPVPLAEDPDSKGKVLYVWFDAPIGYITNTAEWLQTTGNSREDFIDWWKNPDVSIFHFLGEDNIIFHALMWPAMLMAEGTYQLPANVVANSFINIQFEGDDAEKMSKSRGTAVWIGDYLSEYDPDPMRYYLTIIAPENQRATFKMEDLKRRNNDELVGTLGNFIHRTLTFIQKYFQGVVPEAGEMDEISRSILECISESTRNVSDELDAFRFKSALNLVMELAREGNRYFDNQAPWIQRKEDMTRCGTTLNVCVRIVKALAILAEPFLPFMADKTAHMLSLNDGERIWLHADQPVPAGRSLPKPEIIFSIME